MSTLLAPHRQTLRLPTLRPDGIHWHTAGDDLLLRLDFINASDEPTTDEVLVIEAAPLGAFIPFEPITRWTLAGFEPWEERQVEIAIPLRHLKHLDFDDFLEGVAFTEALGRIETKEWWGNIHVVFESAPESAVEMHVAPDCRVGAGSACELEFGVLDSGRFAVDVRSSSAEWRVDAVKSHENGSFGEARVLVESPSVIGSRTIIDISFTRESDLKTIPVRFEFVTVDHDLAAQEN